MPLMRFRLWLALALTALARWIAPPEQIARRLLEEHHPADEAEGDDHA
jgi:hypothetical protein